MARPLRLEHPNALWHVTARGNAQVDIFRDDADREAFLRILGRTAVLFRWRLYAWVLMGNHYHLLLQTLEPTLSRGMRDLNGIYTQAFNRRHGRVGHVLQGRFKAIVVERETHLMELARYVVLNPVRARLVREASRWRWSSYRATAGSEPAPPWLDVEGVLELFGSSPRRARERYRDFVAEGRRSTYEPWGQVVGQVYLGTEPFREEMSQLLLGRPLPRGVAKRQLRPVAKERRALVAEIEKELGATMKELKASPRRTAPLRKRAAAMLRVRGLLPMAEIGELLGVKEWQASALARAGMPPAPPGHRSGT